ncbi:hypothetical protein [Streptomyces virginiae]|uniref:Uncharacterized protein n=1 Tax=Streptomyces virginiae TaxID=1961 RepID=A0ABZ1TQY3_STRVG|nr:hypothetical protein [Streptomyces virginiae]
MSRTLAPPDPGFLPEILVTTDFTTRSHQPVVTLFHPLCHAGSGVETAMRAIAFHLRLDTGYGFPRTGEYVYDIQNHWALDYGHPRKVLQFPAWRNVLWCAVVRGHGGALVAVSLEHEPRPESARILTGRLALRRQAPRAWERAW